MQLALNYGFLSINIWICEGPEADMEAYIIIIDIFIDAAPSLDILMQSNRLACPYSWIEWHSVEHLHPLI